MKDLRTLIRCRSLTQDPRYAALLLPAYRETLAAIASYTYRSLLTQTCAEELSALAIVLYDRLGFADETDELVPVSGTGGVFKIGPAVTDPFARILREHGMEYVEPAATPDVGALMLAIKHGQNI